MDRNYKIAFGLMGTLVLYQAYKIHEIIQINKGIMNVIEEMVDHAYQGMIDEEFDDIVENLE